ncbi:MAG TPA: hypothetical protein VMR52_05610 [Dehalococcoidia bacterium]|nr:hypothetical protein [Dehalococcoidia bacterium]
MAAGTESLKRNAFRTLNWRSIRALAITFVFSLVNLGGAFLALSLVGGTEPWSSAQFVGLFGLLEAGLGLGFVFAPNVWRLPVAEANTSDRTSIRLAASTALIPHWAALAKAGGGFAMLTYAAAAEGISTATLSILALAILIGIAFMAVTVAVARIGVAWPEYDVFFVSIRMLGRKLRDLPGLTISGIIIQLLTNTGIYPTVKLLSPSALYRPEFGPSVPFFVAIAVTTACASAVALVAWRGRISWGASAPQQSEAERDLAGSD